MPEQTRFSSLAFYALAGLLTVALAAGVVLAQTGSPTNFPLTPEDSGKRTPVPDSQKAAGNQPGDKFNLENLGFIENRGQLDGRVIFYREAAGESIFFTREGLCLVMPAAHSRPPEGGSGAAPQAVAGQAGKPQGGQAAILHLKPVGMRAGVEIVPESPLAGKIHYYQGNDPTRWRTGLPTYGAVRYREAYPGIDLKFYRTGGRLEYDVMVKPGADPGQVKFAYEGAKELAVAATGDLAVRLPDGRELLQKKPLVYQQIAGQRVAREGKFRVSGAEARLTYSFAVAGYDPRHPLVIDPVIVYSTYLGGTFWDMPFAITVDAQGYAYVTGWKNSADFPVSGRITVSSDENVFIVKFAPNGELYYTAFLGGSNDDYGTAITVDRYGNAYVAGYTESFNFPRLYPPNSGIFKWGPSLPDYENSFVAKLDEFGELVYSIYLGGEKRDYATAIAVDRDGGVYVGGYTTSPDFPYQGYFQQKSLHPYQGNGDGFVAYIPPDCKAQPDSTFLGGTGVDGITSIVLDSQGNFYVAGNTTSTDFPVKNAAFGTPRGKGDGFVAKINAGFAGLAYSTYLGGREDDEIRGLALLKGSAYVAGWTASSNFPKKNALFNFGGKGDAFVTRLSSKGKLLFSTFLGGNNVDGGRGVAVDPSGNIYVAGSTSSDNFPLKNPLQTARASSSESIIIDKTFRAFVSKISVTGTTPVYSLAYSTKLGGTDGAEEGRALAVDRKGCAYITGITSSHDFPVKNAAQLYNLGYCPGFVTKLKGN